MNLRTYESAITTRHADLKQSGKRGTPLMEVC